MFGDTFYRRVIIIKVSHRKFFSLKSYFVQSYFFKIKHACGTSFIVCMLKRGFETFSFCPSTCSLNLTNRFFGFLNKEQYDQGWNKLNNNSRKYLF